MRLMQYIYSSVLVSELNPRKAFEASALSVQLCQKFGITGRVFANRQQAFVITEGEESVVARYYQSIQNDPMEGTQILHTERHIQKREFNDYSMWLNLGLGFEFSDYVRELTPETLPLAWPANLSAKVRIMADAYLDPEMLIPC